MTAGSRTLKKISHSCVAALAVLLLLPVVLLSTAYQINDIPPLVYVNKFRTWTNDVEATFRSDNATHLSKLPQHRVTVSYPKLAMHSIAVVASTKRVVCFGGMMLRADNSSLYEPFERGTNATYIYDPPTNTWYTESLLSRAVPPPRLDHVSWSVGDNVYIHGGENETIMSDVWRYINRTWRMLNFVGMPNRTGHTMEVVDPIDAPATAYLFGGRDAQGTLRNELFAVSQNGTIRQIFTVGEMPSKRAYHACASFIHPVEGPMMFIHGGYDGFSGLKDLFAYYVRKNRWARLNSGNSGASLSFTGDLVSSISIPPVFRHSCQAKFPTLFCIGGASNGDPISFEFDVSLNRYIQQFFTNPLHVYPLQGHKTLQYSNASGASELIIIGGYTGASRKFQTPVSAFKTTMQMDPCPSPYINTDWLGECHVCPRGSGHNVSINPHRCFPCPMGTFSDYSVCKKCPIGTYNNRNHTGNVSACISCPKGYFTVREGSWAFSQCVTCLEGTYAQNGKCVQCPSGSFGTVRGAMSLDEGCQPCPYGSYSDLGSTACRTCPPGTSGPKFIRALDPYTIAFVGMEQTITGQPTCGGSAPLTTLFNDNYFYVNFQIRDFGELGRVALNAYNPIDIPFFLTSLRLYAYFQGNAGRMYYNCQVGQEMIPGCSYITENQTTPLLGWNQQCTQLGSYQFRLRFTTPSPSTVLYIRGDGLIGVNYTFQVVNKYETVSFSRWPAGFVMGQPRSLEVYAWLNGAIEPSSSFSAKILVQCLFIGQGTGSSLSPTYSVNGNAATNLQTVNIVNGTAVINVDFTQFASGCVFKSQDQFGTITQPNTYPQFSIQKPFAMWARTLTTNTSNWGMIHVEVKMVDIFGATITGDNSSVILLRLWEHGTAVMQPSQMVQTLVNGVTVFSPVVHSLHPYKEFIYGRFEAVHLSGLSTLMPNNITQRFATHHVNGTMLRLVNYSAPFPSVVSVNSSISMIIEHVDRLTGEADASRDVVVQVQIIGCASRITATNHSASVVRVRLPTGHGVVSVFVHGYDSNNCRLNIFEYPTRAGRVAKGFTTSTFDVVSPRIVVRDGCKLSECATCAAPIAGEVVRYNISLQTLAGRLANVDDLVVRFVALGNKSGVVPADNITERRVTGGNVTFPVVYRPSANATGVRFEVGRWVGQEAVNFSYVYQPTFKRFVRSLGVQRKFILISAIIPAVTCLQIPRIIATKISLVSRVPTWSPQNGIWEILFNAVNDYGVIETDNFASVSVQVQNCEHGVSKDLTIQSVHPVTGVATNLYTPATASNNAPFVVTGAFYHGQGTLHIKPLFTTDTDWNGGVRNCDVRITSPLLKTLYIKAPEFRKLYPSCVVCSPGYWSSGGDGRNTTMTYHHPGGCMPCAVGTFSAFSGSSTVLSCSACATNYGYTMGDNVDNTVREGAIQCSFLCAYGTGGQVGGGPCISYTVLARTDVTTNRWATSGRTGRRCVTSGCLDATACANGQWYLSCPAQTTQASCEHPDNLGVCTWNNLSSTCRGNIFNCVQCPAGTVGNGACTLCTKAQGCIPCDAGGWSSDIGHTSRQNNYNLVQYRCANNNYPSYQYRCTGANTGQCWNGTYSTAAGAKDNSTCKPCPQGHYCYQMPIYTSQNVCPPSCAYSQQSKCNTGCAVCPYTEIMKVGSFSPIPCPAGTFNNRTGALSVRQCLKCPAGTRCPEGSVLPIWVDTANTQLSDGKVAPTGVAFAGNPDDVTSCVNEPADNAQGYVQDGRMTNFKRYWTLNTGANYVSPADYKEFWGGKNWLYSAVDRLGDASSGSIQMNATGAIATQKIILSHENPIEMVARVWVQFNLYEKNMSKLIPNAPKPFCGLSLGVHYTDGDETDSDNYTAHAKHFSFTPPTVVNSTKIIVGWYLVEMLIAPKRPVRWVEFSLLVQGYYFGNARFDDASLKPSHRRMCNCSTGFYFNQSERTSRVCRRCPPGFACSGGTMVRCVNSWSAVSYAGCQYCYDGWQCDADGRGRQIPCALYNQKDSHSESCSPCPLGHACRDGNQIQCDNGFYGDGGLDCIPCQPGYYSLPGQPRWQCERCPPGTTSVAARWYCTPCTDNHYSSNGTKCLRCPSGEFAPSGGANACRSCTNLFLDRYNITVSRNRLGFAIRVVPAFCEQLYKFKVERVVGLLHHHLGVATPSVESPSVLYNAGPVVGTHIFRVFVTSGYLQPEQYADVQVRITNTAPIATDDPMITFPHPKKDVVHGLTTLMSNDFDPDLDDIFFATAQLPPTLTQYYASNIVISADRKTIFVNLPANFTGPAHVTYTLMDQYHSSVADCLPPACLFSTMATAKFWCVDAFPIARPDIYSFSVGQVYSIDVLVNDNDVDGDDIQITAVTPGNLSGIFPAIQKSCSSCPGPCTGTYYGTCTCTYDPQLLRCYPSHKREYFLDYTANTGVCGYDSFTYTVKTIDGTASTLVEVRNTRCYCMTKAVGFNMIFLLDGTQSTSDFGFQLNFADSVARRSSEGVNFNYGIIEIGANRVLQNLSNTYFNLDVLSRARDGHRTPYTLGQGLRMADQMMAAYATGPEMTYIVIVTNRPQSFDAANIWGALGKVARFMTVSVGPLGQILPVFIDYFKNPYYEGTAATFVDLTQNSAIIAENMMDIMCSN